MARAKMNAAAKTTALMVSTMSEMMIMIYQKYVAQISSASMQQLSDHG